MPTPSHQTIRLGRGSHSSPDEGACVMELASMLAGEPFNDHPKSVCPVVGAFLRTYNDAVDEDRRQDLYEYAARAVGTRGSSRLTRRRKRACLDRASSSGQASSLRRLLTGAERSGQSAAKSFVEAGVPRHRDALAFIDELIDEVPRRIPDEPLRNGDDAVHEAVETLVRDGAR